MICIGATPCQEEAIVRDAMVAASATRVFVFSTERLAPPWANQKMVSPETECDGRAGMFIDWPDIIRYRFFYRLLQVIDKHTLLVFHESLRAQNRHALTFNCMRHFTLQTPHVLVLQTLPVIDTWDDFATLYDLDTRNRGREAVTPEMVARACEVRVLSDLSPHFSRIDVATGDAQRAAYAAQKRALVDGIGHKDPHTIPRTLHLMAGPARVAVAPAPPLVRNKRLGTGVTYHDVNRSTRVASIVDFPHDFIDLVDVVTLTRSSNYAAVVSDLRADEWYYARFCAWAERVRDATAALRR